MKSIILKHTTPLCFFSDNRLICYQHGDIVVLDSGIVSQRFPLINSFKERVFGRFKLVSRFFRLGVRAAQTIDDSTVLLSIGNFIYELNINSESCSKGYFCGQGIRPLSFTIVKGINSFENGVYFGGYLGNVSKKPVCIYHRIGVDQWESVYTFPQGAINHVHNIVPDPYRQCLWIYTGDFGEASAIWKVTDNFKSIERVACNNQKYRGCVAYALPEGLLYATDAPFADDYIFLMDTDSHKVKELFPIHGSCIYGCQWKDEYVFSSTVEGDGRNMSRWRWLFTRKRGAGIKDEYVHMYIGNLQEGFREIYNEKKDCLPFYTFQFGVFKFPSGVNQSNMLYFQQVATRSCDLCLCSIHL